MWLAGWSVVQPSILEVVDRNFNAALHSLVTARISLVLIYVCVCRIGYVWSKFWLPELQSKWFAQNRRLWLFGVCFEPKDSSTSSWAQTHQYFNEKLQIYFKIMRYWLMLHHHASLYMLVMHSLIHTQYIFSPSWFFPLLDNQNPKWFLPHFVARFVISFLPLRKPFALLLTTKAKLETIKSSQITELQL